MWQVCRVLRIFQLGSINDCCHVEYHHTLTVSRRYSLWHNRPHTPPKIAPHPPPSFPRISIHKLETVPEARSSKLGNVRHISCQRRGFKGGATALVEIKLIRPCQAPNRPVRRRTCRRGRIVSVGHVGGYGRVASRDEIAPDGRESLAESGALIGGGCTVVS